MNVVFKGGKYLSCRCHAMFPAQSFQFTSFVKDVGDPQITDLALNTVSGLL
jgi:hypothetical protein